MVTVDIAQLEHWFQKRPKWLQDATWRLINKETLADEDYNELVNICLSEAKNEKFNFCPLTPKSLSVADTHTPLHLNEISDVQGVNALEPRKPLKFSDKSLCIIYGRNGAGKSGYVRLMKHACNSKKSGTLHPNVYKNSPCQQSAKFSFTVNGTIRSELWDGTPIPEISGIDIFDSVCGMVYVDGENEVSYEPWLLRLFTRITNVCQEVSKRLSIEKDKLKSKLPRFPMEYSNTKTALWYDNISHITNQNDIDKHANWTTEDEKQLTDIQKRLAEPDLANKAKSLFGQKDSVLTVYSKLKALYQALTNEQLNEYRRLEKDAQKKKKAADEDADKVFQNAPLSGIGSDTWSLLWEQARRYSEEYAYKENKFPNTGQNARCVLCQQELDIESKYRLESFETFVKGKLRRLAKDAENAFNCIRDELPSEDISTDILDGIEIINDDTKSRVKVLLEQLGKRKKQYLDGIALNEIEALPDTSTLVGMLKIMRLLGHQARTFLKDAKEQNRNSMQIEQNELAARKWLKQQYNAIVEEVDRSLSEWQISKADKLTNTLALSKQKAVMAEAIISQAYLKRFTSELKKLGGPRLDIEVKKTRTQVGKVYHRLNLKNANTNVANSDILSEGEMRVVALAAFLADTTGVKSKTPFIFDDPISSLDHVYEEEISKRLVEMSKSRQVIVFTHRLSLIGYLRKYADKNSVKAENICLSKYVIGDVAELPIEIKRTDKTVNALLNERLKRAKNTFNSCEASYDIEAKSLCRDIRVLLERVVETDLLNAIVQRFNPEIQTKGKIDKLAGITEEDCQFIDQYMTKYSRYEHSQPEEAPVALPEPDEFEKDLVDIKDYIENIKNRNRA